MPIPDFGQNPRFNDDDYIKRSLFPYALAARQLGQYRDAANLGVRQGTRRFNRDVRGSARAFGKQRRRIPTVINRQARETTGAFDTAAQFAGGDLQAQGFDGVPAQVLATLNSVRSLGQGTAQRQRSYMADQRVADRAYGRDIQNTGSILNQAGRTSIQQSYMDAMAALYLQRLQTQIQLRNQFDNPYGY